MIKTAYNNYKEKIHNFIWRLSQIVGKQGITFLIFILCAKMLSPYDFGLYNYALAVIFFIILFCDFGISTAISKYVAEYRITDKNKLNSVLFNFGILILGLTLIITLLTIIFGQLYFKERYVYIFYLIPLVFLAPMTSLYDGIYRGLERFKYLAIVSLLVGFLSTFFVYLLIESYGLIGALLAQNLFYILLLAGLSLGYREFNFKINKEIIKECVKYSLIIGFTNLGYFFYTKLNTLLLANSNLILEVSYFEFVSKFFEFGLLPSIILGQILGPSILNEYLNGKNKLFLNNFYKQLLAVLIAGLIISLLLLALFHTCLTEIFPKYNISEVKILFNIMILVFPLRFLTGFLINGHTINTGHAHYSLYATISAGLINIILCIQLIPKIGLLAVAYASLISYTIYGFSFIILYWRKLYGR